VKKVFPNCVAEVPERGKLSEYFEDDVQCASTKRPDRGGKRGIVWAIMENDRQEGNAQVCDPTKPNPPNHNVEYRAIHIKQKHAKAGKEEEKGKM
jgi:hypothetical protein